MSATPHRVRDLSFEDFWRFYFGEHADPLNRRLHVAGTTAALALIAYALLRRRPLLLLLAPVVGYAPAWIGHFFVEHNQPATMSNPLWALRADLKMLYLVATGNLEHELDRGQTPRVSV